MGKRLPPNIGLDANKPMLYSPYQQEFLKARRMRFAPCCKKIGFCGADGLFRCPSCGKECTMTAPRVYRRLGCFAGRRGGKSVVGAHGAREEMLVPNSLGWICGPSYEKLHDATMPTILRLLPETWCQHWDAEHLTLTLVNGAKVAFRSLDDPDRAHSGVGLHWAWFDEAAFIAVEAWDYFQPSLADFGGVAFFTSSVDGYDWTYDRIEKPALIEHKPGFWAAKWRTIDNPYMAAFRAAEIEDARASMPPQMFRQEYEGERENFTGAVYGEWIDTAWLATPEDVERYIPEWPKIDPSRRVLVGLDSGSDHPFGAVALVVTERGIIAVKDYLERRRAYATHIADIKLQFAGTLGDEVLWTANRNEGQLRSEFDAHGVHVAMAENDQAAGLQRVLSWLYTSQLKIAYTCPRTFEQMKKLRYADNLLHDGQKREKEKVFKKEDELPDCVRYALMTWPSLPKGAERQIGRDLSKLDPRTRWELDKIRKFASAGEDRDLKPTDKEYPLGNFWGNDDDGDLAGASSAFYG